MQVLHLEGDLTSPVAVATNTTINGGEQDVLVGIAENTTIIGGAQVVGSNGIAENTTIEGGIMHVMAGGVTEGNITFAGIGMLVIDQPVSSPTSFATPLVGVQPHDTFDLTGLPFAPGATAVLSDSQLTVSSGNDSETFTLQNLNPSVTEFLAASDNNGGTEVTAVDFLPLPRPRLTYDIAIAGTVNTVPNGTTAVVDVLANTGTTINTANGAHNTVVTYDIARFTGALANPLSNAVGDPGNTLNGADSGMDTFVFSGDFGQNTINNFIINVGNHDTLELSHAQFGDLATMIKVGDIQQVGTDTLITNPLNPADTIRLIGISALALESHPSNFHFV